MQPSVAAICLTRNRPEMLKRARASFHAQTYPAQWVELDTSVDVVAGKTIGELRNIACGYAPRCDIFVTFDDDDVSHPNRISEQVAHLQSSGVDVVGYDELLFWRTLPHRDETLGMIGDAWIYKAPRGTAPGTSLCYWRKTWERKPFPDLPTNKQSTGEDVAWLRGLKLATVSSIVFDRPPRIALPGAEAMLIAGIHGGNTMSYDLEGMIARGSREWRRTPEWDNFARERMAL